MVATLGNQWAGKICFAGKALEPEMWQHAKRLGIQNRIVSVVKPDHRTLQALYTMCEAFIFPSFSEGFGWPVIEAQACGAPVIASNIEPMPEIGSEAALFADPAKPETFSSAFLRLQEEGIREEMIQKGFCNVRRFQPEMMIQEYLKIHGLTAYVSESN
jgi:glycosyltransferase involved in cell wall biosynthesis